MKKYDEKTINKIIEILKNMSGANSNRGCYINGRWFSPAVIIEMLERMKEAAK